MITHHEEIILKQPLYHLYMQFCHLLKMKANVYINEMDVLV